MREEQFDHIESRIREAAENTRPDFNETAWVKMEALLDADKKRRPVFWLWALVPLLLLGAGSFYFINSHKNIQSSGQHIDEPSRAVALQQNEPVAKENNSTAEIAKDNNTDKKIKVPEQGEAADIKAVVASPINKLAADGAERIKTLKKTKYPDKNNSPTVSVNAKAVLSKIQPDIVAGKGLVQSAGSAVQHIPLKKAGNNTHSKKITDTRKSATKASVKPAEAGNEEENLKEPITASKVHEQDTDKTATSVISNQSNKAADSTHIDRDPKAADKKDIAAITKKKPAEERANKGVLSKFYLLAAAGADNANVKLLSFTNSETVPKYGVGIGYQFTKRISVQTGFYVSHKKYIAGPADYTLKPNPYWNTVQLMKIDGDCKVYEIPLALRYNFVQTKHMNYYAIAGLSSYIMKTEDYHYHYKRYNMYYNSPYYYTGNKSYFSVLTIAAGIERKLSSKFYLQAEPAIAIPLAGVGDGKVKLYSSSLLIGLKYYPFKKR